MANNFTRMSPGMYRGPNGQTVRSQQMPQQRPMPSGTRGEIGPIGGYPPGMQQPQPMAPQGAQAGGWRSGPNMSPQPPAPMGPAAYPDQGMVGIGGFEQQQQMQQQPYYGPPPRSFGDAAGYGQAGGGPQMPMQPPQMMNRPPPPAAPRRNLMGKMPGAGILTQPPKGNVY